MTIPSKESLAAAQGIDDYYDYGWTETRHNVVCEIIDRAFAEKMKAAQKMGDALESIKNILDADDPASHRADDREPKQKAQ